MVVVVNDKLMDNHQMEIASVMGQVCTHPQLPLTIWVL